MHIKSALTIVFIAIFMVVLSKVSAQTSTISDAERLLQKCQAYQQNNPTAQLPSVCVTALSATPSPTTSPIPDVETSPTPSSTPSPSPTVEINYCEDHNPTEYHALYNAEADCWYDHEHGDDPSTVDDIFGETSSWWGGEQSISYPWQTFGFEGSMSGGGSDFPTRTGAFENDAKHQGYKWHVRRDLPCYSQFADGCITAIRSIDHADGSHGIHVRFHSFAVEMLVCPESRPTDCGIVRTGGWADKGNLAIDNQIVPGYGPTQINGGTRLHNYSGNQAFATWYGGSNKADVVTQFEDMWVTVNPADPNTIIFRCPDDPNNCGYNSSKRQLHLVGSRLQPTEVRWLRQQGHIDANGKINYTGFTNRYGTLIRDNSCTTASLDCVPISYSNYDSNFFYQYRGDAREYDTSIGVLPVSPIKYPN